jgi:hypothetical protein
MSSMQAGDPRVAADVLAEEAAAAQAPAEESSDDDEAGGEPATGDMTVAQLRDLADSRGVDLTGASTKADILDRLSGTGGSGSVSGSGSGSVPEPGAEQGPEAGGS